MLKYISVNLIRAYQNSIRFMLPACCRFSPSCSEYAKLSFVKYGFWRGALKAGKRLLKCHPFSDKPVYDPLS